MYIVSSNKFNYTSAEFATGFLGQVIKKVNTFLDNATTNLKRITNGKASSPKIVKSNAFNTEKLANKELYLQRANKNNSTLTRQQIKEANNNLRNNVNTSSNPSAYKNNLVNQNSYQLNGTRRGIPIPTVTSSPRVSFPSDTLMNKPKLSNKVIGSIKTRATNTVQNLKQGVANQRSKYTNRGLLLPMQTAKSVPSNPQELLRRRASY